MLCRTPSEVTTQLWTVFWLLARPEETLGSLARYSEAALKIEHSRVKAAFKSALVGVPAADIVLEVLPSTAALLKSDHPELYESVHGSSHPIVCPIDLSVVQQGTNLWKCRGQISQPVARLQCAGSVRSSGMALTGPAASLALMDEAARERRAIMDDCVWDTRVAMMRASHAEF